MILLIRTLLLKSKDLKKYKAVLALQDHFKEREETGKTKIIEKEVMPIVQMYKLQEAHEQKVQVHQ